MSGPKHTPLSGPCPSCEGRGYDCESGDWSMDQPIKVACPDCAGTGKAENSITANEKLCDAAPRLAEELAAWRAWAERWGHDIETSVSVSPITHNELVERLAATNAALREAGE